MRVDGGCGGEGDGFRELGGFVIRTSAEFTIHHVQGRAVNRRYHSDGHLTFVVVITFRVIVIIIIIDIHATIVSNNLFHLCTARCLSFCRLHRVGLGFLHTNWSALLGTYLNRRLRTRERRGLCSNLRRMRDRGFFFLF